MIEALLEQVATTEPAAYDPAEVIQAVNALQPLGKEPALATISDFLAGRPAGREEVGLFWVLRVLFDLPAGQDFPPVRIGAPSIPPPTDPRHLPRFPVLIVQDIPLLVVRGYMLGGLPEPVDAHVQFFRRHGILRRQPLTPPTALAGIEAEAARQWRAAYGEAHASEARATIQEQLARLAQHRA